MKIFVTSYSDTSGHIGPPLRLRKMRSVLLKCEHEEKPSISWVRKTKQELLFNLLNSKRRRLGSSLRKAAFHTRA